MTRRTHSERFHSDRIGLTTVRARRPDIERDTFAVSQETRNRTDRSGDRGTRFEPPPSSSPAPMAALVRSSVTLTLRSGAAFRQKRATRKAGVVVRASSTKPPSEEDDTGSSRRHMLSASLAAAVAVRPCSSPNPPMLFVFFALGLNSPRESTFSTVGMHTFRGKGCRISRCACCDGEGPKLQEPLGPRRRCAARPFMNCMQLHTTLPACFLCVHAFSPLTISAFNK